MLNGTAAFVVRSALTVAGGSNEQRLPNQYDDRNSQNNNSNNSNNSNKRNKKMMLID
jgi:hypothetical protein